MATDDFVVTTAEELHDRIDHAHQRFAAVVGGVPADLPVGMWRAHDVVAHVLNVINRYNDFDPGRLAAGPRGVDEINQRELEALDGHSVDELLACLGDEMTRFRGHWGPGAGIPLDTALPFHGGATIDFQSALTNVIGEFLVHGLDVARADGQPWTIDDRDGALLCGFATQLLPYYVRGTNVLDLIIDFRLDGVGPWVLDVSGPRARSRRPEPGEHPDLVVAGAAVPAALLVYSRVDLSGAEAAGLHVSSPRGVDRSVLTGLFEEP